MWPTLQVCGQHRACAANITWVWPTMLVGSHLYVWQSILVLFWKIFQSIFDFSRLTSYIPRSLVLAWTIRHKMLICPSTPNVQAWTKESSFWIKCYTSLERSNQMHSYDIIITKIHVKNKKIFAIKNFQFIVIKRSNSLRKFSFRSEIMRIRTYFIFIKVGTRNKTSH